LYTGICFLDKYNIKWNSSMKIKDIQESTVAGSIASVAKPLGELQTRSKPEKAPKVTKGKKYANTISEGAVKELLYNLKHMDADEFQKVYKKSKEFFQKTDKPIGTTRPSATSSKTGSQVWHDTGYTDKKAAAQAKEEPIQEDELKEEDLIILPGMLRGKDKSFISKEHDRRDHEVEMARSDVYAAAKDAMRIFKILENRTEDEGLMGWQQSYITLASDYLNSVADSLEYDAISNEGAVGKIVNALAKSSVKDLPKTPETQRAIASQAMKIEKNLDRAAKVGTAAVGGAAGKEIYDKSKKANEGVIAGGMSNAEESVAKGSEILKVGTAVRVPHKGKMVPGKIIRYDSGKGGESPAYVVDIGEYESKIVPVHNMKQGVAEGRYGRYYDPMGDERREQQAMDDERRDFKRREMEYELRNEPKNNYAVAIDGRVWKVFGDRQQAENIARSLVRKGKKATVHITGASISEEQAPMFTPESKLDEKKDACYTKVKSRYKVWPSAYASGALSKCRKVGASNWGNKSKK
jgi:hypothetical protein